MLETLEELPGITHPHLDECSRFCEQYGLVGKVQADHLGIKCSSNAVYEKQRKVFESDTRFIYQSVISQRRISIIGLREGLDTSVGGVRYIELADQKPDNSQKDAVDHIELVPQGISYEELVSFLQNQGVAMKEVIRSHHVTYDITLPSGFGIKLSREMLVDKVYQVEML